MLLALLAAISLQSPTDAGAEPKPHRRHDFFGVNIHGELVGPPAIVYARPSTKFRNLIALRKDFRPEMTKAADGI
jgi:hypothetical protein